MTSTSEPAAAGSLNYQRADNGTFDHIDNPNDGQCYPLTGGAQSVRNDTNSTANLYSDDQCAQFADAVQPGKTAQYGANFPYSVQFG